jgi:hypothetical protein
VSQPPYGSPYGPPQHQQPDPGLGAPVDPYQSPPGQSYNQDYPSSPAYPSYGDPGGYPDPVSGYPGNPYQQQSSPPGYADQGYPQQADQGYPQQTQPYYQPQPQSQPGYGGPGYPGSPGYPPTPSPSGGGGNRAVVVVLVVALVVILVGGGIGLAVFLSKKSGTPTAGSTTAGAPATTGATGGPSASPTPTLGATHSGDLRTFLIEPPSGSRNWSKPLGTDRNLSLDQASELSSDPKARKDMLNQYNFTHGAVQCWISSGSVYVVDVRLYQFDTPDHADGFFRDNLDATGAGYTSPNTTDVAGVPRAKAYADPKKDAQGYVSLISIGIKGDVVFVVSIGEKGDKIDQVPSDKLMQQQLQKL